MRSCKSNIRICSINPGCVETELHVKASLLSKHNAAEYPDVTISAEDVADNVRYILSLPPNVEVNELVVRPVTQDM